MPTNSPGLVGVLVVVSSMKLVIKMCNNNRITNMATH